MKPNITIGHFPIIDHLILGIAQKNDGGYFGHFNLRTKIFRNWAKMIDNLNSKKIDGAFLLFPLAIELFRKLVTGGSKYYLEFEALDEFWELE